MCMKTINRVVRVKRQFPGLSFVDFALLEAYRRLRSLLFNRRLIDSSGMMSIRRKRAWDIDDEVIVSGAPELICVSGFGFSGSSVVVDLLWEYEGVNTNGCIEPDGSVRKAAESDLDFEFQMLRTPFGVFGFERFLNSNFFDDGDRYVHLFVSMIADYYYNQGYVFGDRFLALSREFLNDILQFKVNKSASAMATGFYPPIGNRGANLLWGTYDDYMYVLKRMSIAAFRKRAGKYVRDVLSLLPYRGKYVLDQIVSDGTGDVDKYLEYLGDVKIISVRRDPRDVLANVRRANEHWIPYDVDDFIFWYRVANQGYFGKTHPNLLSLRFEDIVLDYDESCSKVESFVGLTAAQHVRKHQGFDPAVSRLNVGIYKKFLTREEAEKIYSELREYCI